MNAYTRNNMLKKKNKEMYLKGKNFVFYVINFS